MNKLEDTLSLCEYCYRHIPAVRFERNNAIWLGKTCKWHGYVERLVEPDADFYLTYSYHRHALGTYCIDITNRCNLACPQCYQEPDNTSKDPSITKILELISNWPDDGFSVALMGAEPTTRKDLPELIRAIQGMPGKMRRIMILTNGVYLSDYEYAKEFAGIKGISWTIGLNHPDYQGHAVRAKQMEGMQNCAELGLVIKNISYTLEDMNQMEYCLDEIQLFGYEKCQSYRIRCGAEIGRFPGGPKIYLSELVANAKRIANLRGWSVDIDHGDGNRSHYPLIINGIVIKIIQWPDVTTIDLKEIQTESIADMLPGLPPSPLVHQVILRDGTVNKGQPLYDKIPQEYINNYGNKRD